MDSSMDNSIAFRSNDRWLLPWTFVVFTIFFLSILRGIRFPNIWSYSHFLFNYEFGLVKRGLIGEIIKHFDSPWLSSYNFFVIVSALIFIANIMLLSLLIRDLLNSRNSVLIGGSVIFVSSLAVVFLSHSIGYFDHIGLLITLVTIRINGFGRKILFLLPSLTLGLLIHEAITIIFFPVIFMSLLFDVQAENRKNQFMWLVLLSILVISFTWWVSNLTIEKPKTQEMYNNLQTKTGYALRKDAFNVLHRSGKDNFIIMKKKWFQEERWLSLIKSFLGIFPVLLTIMYLMVYMLRESNTKVYLLILAVLASLSPQLLHMFGWDRYRWNTLTITTSFLMLYVVYRSRNHLLLTKLPNNIYPIFILVIFLNGISTIQLFDGYSVKLFPFTEHRAYIIDVITGKEKWPYLPKR